MNALDSQAFTRAMVAAVEAARVDCYFEEGGCWGMAAALHAHFTAQGLPAIVKYTPADFIHAWVEVNGVAYDYKGATEALPDAVSICPEELEVVARRYGYDAEEYLHMTTYAAPIVANAWRLMSERRSTLRPSAGYL
ncbi:hypothetical protein F6X40_09830 [Paraburkholderia sp. UCT31]|uniref:hypothetical protein n=1 Tax=Paraburkholderia sp. UCT31 TaxID=2615209 RepID=UPI0016560E3C|nr:hypothetical protein [Paraburkholderia sp. UCT31]MBC8737107.1 hypothetical protein [Paraburkholderia sp. UCT31]